MWKPEHRVAADRRGLRYPSDMTDAEWELVAALIPAGCPRSQARSRPAACSHYPKRTRQDFD